MVTGKRPLSYLQIKMNRGGVKKDMRFREEEKPRNALTRPRESYTTSLSSGIRNHTYENGRRYHAFRAGSAYAPVF